MVVFICDSCNESLKKNSVALHLTRCRPAAISCCDCSKEFADDSYKDHNQCISENAKYGPESQRSMATPDKGKMRQDAWLSSIKEILKSVNISGPVEMALNKLLEYPNIPNKKQKFENFALNCLHLKSKDIVDQLWDICESALKATKEQQPQSGKKDKTREETTKSTDEITEDQKSSKKDKKKKRKRNDEEPESGENASASADDQEKGEESTPIQDKENSDQTNGDDKNSKKSKKKKKQDSNEGDQEKEQTNGNNDHKEIEQNESSLRVPQIDDVQESSDNTENVKKKSKKKKKRNHSETEENNQETNNPEDVGSIENDDTRKKIKEETETTVDQDSGKINEISSEPNSDSNDRINWFKQLKRQIKEKEIVELKDFKKMMKRLKKEHNLDGDFSDLIAKAKVKLMKRHNYSVAEGQIKYKRIF